MLTELVVIAAFLSRFWFDRSLVNLRELRIQKEAVVDSYDTVLQTFLKTQSQLITIRNILNSQYNAAGRLTDIQSATPEGVEYEEIEVSSRSATIRGTANSGPVLSGLLSHLQQAPGVTKVSIKLLELSKKRFPGYDFEVNLTLTSGQEKKSNTAT